MSRKTAEPTPVSPKPLRATRKTIETGTVVAQPRVRQARASDFPPTAGIEKLLAALNWAKQRVRRDHLAMKKASYTGQRMPVGAVTGVALGTKVRGGTDTGEPCLVFHVPYKVRPKELGLRSLHHEVPEVTTDVVDCEVPRAHAASVADPLQGGESIAHWKIAKGTAGCLVTRPTPGHPGKRDLFVLGANHVLAACNESEPGDPILHVSRGDGGQDPEDISAKLTAYARIDWQNYNTVDAAIAAIDPRVARKGLVNGESFIPEVLPPAAAGVVFKVGAASGYTEGVIHSHYYSGRIYYNEPIARSALFAGLLKVSPTNGFARFSEPGDSGALVVDQTTKRPVGLVIAGADDSYVCPLGPTLSVLGLTLYG